nr:SulP family inorganic anion transporter [uncultured Merdimonas sp.]
MKGYSLSYLPKDIFSGIIIAAVSIPISMGYAEVSGLPPVYGLYGSLLPILFYAAFTKSRQFIFGVDATPAALTGATLASLGIAAGSREAMAFVPVMALFTGLWLLLFYFLKAGKIVDFISTPVMGGFISGIGIEIILMQIPKILGGKPTTGEAPELLLHILETAQEINWVSFALGITSFVIIMVSTKLIPKFPMPIVIMLLGAGISAFFPLGKYDVALLSHVDPGLPSLVLPDLLHADLPHVIGRSLMVAAVVMAETLLASSDFALKNGYKLNDNREILACSAGNLAAAFTGSCPVNGSISRTSMNDQYGGHTQAVSITASAAMVLLLLFGTGFIEYLPVPVLTAIVLSALTKVVEVHLAVRLWKVRKRDFFIFLAAMFGVLFLGTIYGVVIGMMLSFITVILEFVMEAANPPRTFLGHIPGKKGFYNMNKEPDAIPFKHVVIYRFSERLFFANVKIFQQDIEKSLTDDTRTVIVDATGINSIDITAADRLALLSDNLEKSGVAFYLVETKVHLDRQMDLMGIGHLSKTGHIMPTIEDALAKSQQTS